jgi:hypothetical protein
MSKRVVSKRIKRTHFRQNGFSKTLVLMIFVAFPTDHFNSTFAFRRRRSEPKKTSTVDEPDTPGIEFKVPPYGEEIMYNEHGSMARLAAAVVSTLDCPN